MCRSCDAIRAMNNPEGNVPGLPILAKAHDNLKDGDIVSLVGRATGKDVKRPSYMPLGNVLPDFGKEERGPRPAALEELRQAAEILENMDGAGGLGDETKFLRLMSEALFMFDQDARQRMLRWLNSACA